MMQLDKRDYGNIGMFLLMFFIISFSYVNSDFYKGNSGNAITGNTIRALAGDLPDFVLSVEAPDAGETFSSINVNITVTNDGAGDYTGDVVLNIDYGDDIEIASETVTMDANPKTVTVSHSYQETGNFTITAQADPSGVILEEDENNNNGTAEIEISQGNVCGIISSSITLSQDVECNSGINITAAGITLNCNNHKISGSTKFNSNVGILLFETATILNCSISDFDTGIKADAAINLYNSTISDTLYGLKILKSGNNIKWNIFQNNNVSILNDKETAITYNDFLSNNINIDSIIDINFTRNYFGTEIYDNIIGTIENNSNNAVSLLPFLDGSARDPSSSEITTDIKAPVITDIDVKKEQDNYEAVISIVIKTDEESSCRYSIDSAEWENMSALITTNSLTHSYNLIYNEEGTIEINFLCKDLAGNPSPIYTTDEIVIENVLDLIIEQLDDEIRAYDEDEDEMKSEKDERKDELDELNEEDDQDEIDKLYMEIDKLDIEINYYEQVKANSEDLQTNLTELKEKIATQLDVIEENNNQTEDFLIDLDEYNALIDQKIDSGDTSVYNELSEKNKVLAKLYNAYEKNFTKNNELVSLKDDFDIAIEYKLLKDLEHKKTKYEELQKIESGSQNYIDQLSYDIDDRVEKIADKEKKQELADAEAMIDTLEKILDLRKDQLNEVKDLISITDERMDYAKEIEDYDFKAELERAMNEMELSKDAINKEIDKINADITELEKKVADLKVTPEEKSDFIAELFIDLSKVSLKNRLLINGIPGLVAVYDPNILLDRVEIKMNGTAESGTSMSINRYKYGRYDYKGNLKILQIYLINHTSDVTMSNMKLVFVLNESFLNQSNLSADNISIYRLNQDGSEEEENTTYYFEDDAYTFESLIFEQGVFALAAYVEGINDSINFSQYETNETCTGAGGYWYNETCNAEEENADKEPECLPDYICEDWPECQPEDKIVTTTCYDANNCENKTEEENKIIQEKQCNEDNPDDPPGDDDATCNDGVQNQDEEGVDCGGVCEEECPDDEDPGAASTIIKKPKSKGFKNSPVMLGVIVSFVLLTVGSVVYSQKKKIKGVVGGKKKEKKDSKDLNTEIINYAIGKLFYYEDISTIRAELIKTNDEKTVDFYLPVIQYILPLLEKSAPYKNIISDFVNKGWDENQATSTVTYIVTKYVSLQMKELNSSEKLEDSEKSMLRDMFTSEGYDNEIINSAFEMLTKQNAEDKKNKNKKKDKK